MSSSSYANVFLPRPFFPSELVNSVIAILEKMIIEECSHLDRDIILFALYIKNGNAEDAAEYLRGDGIRASKASKSASSAAEFDWTVVVPSPKKANAATTFKFTRVPAEDRTEGRSATATVKKTKKTKKLGLSSLIYAAMSLMYAQRRRGILVTSGGG
mmetsp:Transcript_1822/g.3296  ORF Transcript_1822/g.3296 Transcript_1822/m.3296 type:complete len:158 (-) Transcript_1822:364-837(-)